MNILSDVETLAAPGPVVQDNFEKIEEGLFYPTAPTRVAGVATNIIGPPTAATPHDEDERWVDANGALWVCTASGSPGTFKQLTPALMVADPVAGAYPLGYRIVRTDLRYLERRCTVAGTPGTWDWVGLELTAIADLAGGASLADVITAVNTVLARLRTGKFLSP